MKSIATAIVLILLATTVHAQQSDSLRFRIKIDSCQAGTTLYNDSTRVFYLTVKNTSKVLTMFKSGEMEIGIKMYVNRITEDEETFTIIKHVFMKKETGEDDWRQISSSDYYPLENMGFSRSIKVGSDKEVPDFFIQYEIRQDDGNTDPFNIDSGKKRPRKSEAVPKAAKD